MRLSIAAVVLGVAACATTPAPKGTPTSFQPVCMPCPMPCTPETSCKQAVAAAPKPAPAPAPAPAPKPAAEAPTFSPAPGQFEGSQQVTLSSSTPNAVIHYTLDGSEPTESSPVYSGPITVSQSTTIKAIALAPGAPASSVASGAFTAAPPPPPPTPRVTVTKEKLELQEKVYFDTGKATIKPVSFGLLDEVATALKGHDEVKKVRIEGHTDNVGNPKSNLKLSQARADAVRTYLVDKGGIPGDRLEAKGFGDTQPVGPNKTAKQREANRRVEFRVVQ